MGLERIISANSKSEGNSFDGHVHSLHSYDVFPDEAHSPISLYKKAMSMGLKFFTITDHDSINSHKELKEMQGFVPGVEISLNDPINVGFTTHFNVYNLNQRQFIELEKIAGRTINSRGYGQLTHQGDLLQFVDFLGKEGLLQFSCYNHPFWFERGEIREIPYDKIRQIMRMFPVTELNGHRTENKNLLTLQMAEEEKIGLLASTDTHSGQVGKAYTLAQGDTFEEFYENVRKGNSYLKVSNMDADALKHEIRHILDMVFKKNLSNSGIKIASESRIIDKMADYLIHGRHKTLPRPAAALLREAVYLVNNLNIPSLYVKWVRSQHNHIPGNLQAA